MFRFLVKKLLNDGVSLGNIVLTLIVTILMFCAVFSHVAFCHAWNWKDALTQCVEDCPCYDPK